jgi:hypothetical protein
MRRLGYLIFESSRAQYFLEDLLPDIMRRKLLRRTRRHQGELSLADRKNIETRASSEIPQIANCMAV